MVPVVKNPPGNAGDTGSLPGWGIKIPHAVGQLSPCAQLERLSATTKIRVLQLRMNTAKYIKKKKKISRVAWIIYTGPI